MNSTTPLVSSRSLLRLCKGSLLLLLAAVLFPVANCNRDVRLVYSSAAGSSPVEETPRSAFDFVQSIGLNTHLNYFDRIYGNFPLVKRELESLGVLHLRDGVHLQNADYNAALYDRWIQLGSLGVRFDAVLDPRSNLDPLNGQLLDRVETLAGHTIESFEGPNELDVSDESDWRSIDRSYQNAIFDSVKSMQNGRSIAVIGPSLASATNSSLLGDLSDSMDMGNLHPYPAGQMPSIVFPSQIDLEKIVSADKPIDFTESGYHNAINEKSDQPGISEAAAAKYISRLFLEDFAHGVPRTYLYEFMDEAPDPGLTDPQMHWGLIRADGSEKPAFAALKNLIAELSDSSEPASLRQLTWSLNSKDAQIHHLLLEKSNGTFDLIFWQEISSYDVVRQTDIHNPDVTAALTLRREARRIALYQPATQAGPAHIWNDETSVPLEIPDQPLVLEISF
ncbi:MAG: hypothetical protein WBE72_10380 [Terracidiphilus sp.]